MNWKKVNLLDYAGNYVFLDKYGYCRLESVEIVNVTKTSGVVHLRNFYMYDSAGKNYVKIARTSITPKELLTLALSKEIYTKKPTQNVSYYGFGYREPEVLSAADVQKVPLGSLHVYLKIVKQTINSNYGNSNLKVDEYIPIAKESDIEKIEGWYLGNSNFGSFKHAIFKEIKVGDDFFYYLQGKVKVTKVLDYPDEKNRYCQLMDNEGKEFQIVFCDPYLYHLPYKKVRDEFDELNKNINELSLSPYVVNKDGIVNIQWLPVENAARYLVVSYRIMNVPGRNRVYHLRDVEVDRNTNVLTFNDLVGDGLAFKVKAEDRNGKLIAETRCLLNGFETKQME